MFLDFSRKGLHLFVDFGALFRALARFGGIEPVEFFLTEKRSRQIGVESSARAAVLSNEKQRGDVVIFVR